MTKAFVLMTALPPTLGHLDLIKFASSVGDETIVIVCTQPGEPFVEERVVAIREALWTMDVRVENLHRTIQQEPGDTPDEFWEMWSGILRTEYGFETGDYIVASEPYGLTLAEKVGGVFIPYDIDRNIRYTRASEIRDSPEELFSDILPEFRRYLKKTITFFGAESTGKTTTSKVIAKLFNTLWLPEWARPYLELVGPDLTTDKMLNIANAQRALQITGQDNLEHYFVIQDTDLFSTLGFWEAWDDDWIPTSLKKDAHFLKSDLYIILSSDIPYEPDPLRYGGDKRETPDQFWIDLCEREGLNYVYITETGSKRNLKALAAIFDAFPDNYLEYQREGEQYK